MSAYVRNQQVMYPIDKDLLKKLGVGDAWDLEDKYKVLDVDYSKHENYFEMQPTVGHRECHYYLAYTLKSYYGGYAGEFGRSRVLNENEQAKYKKLFEETFGIEFDSSKFRYVDYCYYNGSDAPDFYDAVEEEI